MFVTTLFFLVWGGAVSGTKFKIEQIEVISKGKLRPTKILEDKNREQVETSQYGGWLNRNLGGTGFFRTQKDGADGGLWILRGICLLVWDSTVLKPIILPEVCQSCKQNLVIKQVGLATKQKITKV